MSMSIHTVNPLKIKELREIDEDGSDETLRELIKIFYLGTPPKLMKMMEFYYKKDYLSLRKEAHALRSSTLIMGADKLTALASLIEYAEVTPNLDKEFNINIKAAMNEYHSVKEVFDSLTVSK